MIDLDDFWYIVRSQHYTKREMEIIYGNLEYVPPKQIDKLWDKAVDKWGDWQAAQLPSLAICLNGFVNDNCWILHLSLFVIFEQRSSVLNLSTKILPQSLHKCL